MPLRPVMAADYKSLAHNDGYCKVPTPAKIATHQLSSLCGTRLGEEHNSISQDPLRPLRLPQAPEQLHKPRQRQDGSAGNCEVLPEMLRKGQLYLVGIWHAQPEIYSGAEYSGIWICTTKNHYALIPALYIHKKSVIWVQMSGTGRFQSQIRQCQRHLLAWTRDCLFPLSTLWYNVQRDGSSIVDFFVALYGSTGICTPPVRYLLSTQSIFGRLRDRVHKQDLGCKCYVPGIRITGRNKIEACHLTYARGRVTFQKWIELPYSVVYLPSNPCLTVCGVLAGPNKPMLLTNKQATDRTIPYMYRTNVALLISNSLTEPIQMQNCLWDLKPTYTRYVVLALFEKWQVSRPNSTPMLFELRRKSADPWHAHRRIKPLDGQSSARERGLGERLIFSLLSYRYPVQNAIPNIGVSCCRTRDSRAVAPHIDRRTDRVDRNSGTVHTGVNQHLGTQYNVHTLYVSAAFGVRVTVVLIIPPLSRGVASGFPIQYAVHLAPQEPCNEWLFRYLQYEYLYVVCNAKYNTMYCNYSELGRKQWGCLT
ncbi:hypothetical protein ACRALDRAFT_205317 [Sodiomyces alcalophilus JCM 7366]|uniref:uncharacterized protein n=1 Tax=Sodiomyces alcalophilus JCM 7366 TaxID=591952 RepID=UPI0039B4BBB3